jgi:hypothetical protein
MTTWPRPRRPAAAFGAGEPNLHHGTKLRLCPVLPHMMPKKTSAGLKRTETEAISVQTAAHCRDGNGPKANMHSSSARLRSSWSPQGLFGTGKLSSPQSHIPKQLSSAPPRHKGGRWRPILGHLLAILRTSAIFWALRPSLISVNQIRWPPNFELRLCPVLPHMMPKKTSAGPKRGGASWGFASRTTGVV